MEQIADTFEGASLSITMVQSNLRQARFSGRHQVGWLKVLGNWSDDPACSSGLISYFQVGHNKMNAVPVTIMVVHPVPLCTAQLQVELQVQVKHPSLLIMMVQVTTDQVLD